MINLVLKSFTYNIKNYMLLDTREYDMGRIKE